MEWSIATQTGWSIHYIRWELNWPQLQMMLADAPRLKKRGNTKHLVDDNDLEFLINGNLKKK